MVVVASMMSGDAEVWVSAVGSGNPSESKAGVSRVVDVMQFVGCEVALTRSLRSQAKSCLLLYSLSVSFECFKVPAVSHESSSGP